MTEKWKPVVGYEGMYEISNEGRLKTIAHVSTDKNGYKKTYQEHIRIPGNSNRGYPMANLWKDGTKTTISVHRLVLEAFIGPRPKGMQCRHFPDRTKTNNRLSNLSWGTPEQNTADKVHHDTMARGEDHGRSKITEKDVRRIRKEFDSGERTGTIAKKYARKLGVCTATVYYIMYRKRWKHVE